MARDPFDLLGLPARFDLDEEAIRGAWLRLSGGAHPDRVGGAGSDPGGEAERSSAAINEARRTLADPERRAAALLARLGGPSETEDKSLPSSLLLEYMEAREELETAIHSADAEAVARSREWAEDRRRAHIERVAGYFSAVGASGNPEALRAIRTELNAWRYAERMLEQARDVDHG